MKIDLFDEIQNPRRADRHHGSPHGIRGHTDLRPLHQEILSLGIVVGPIGERDGRRVGYLHGNVRIAQRS